MGVVKSVCSIGCRFREMEASRAPSPPALFPGGGGSLSSAVAGLVSGGTSVLMALAVKLVWYGRPRVCSGRLFLGGVIGCWLDAGVSSRFVVVTHGSGDARFSFWLLGFRSWAFGPCLCLSVALVGWAL
ncbi:hypothetical protein YC2023_100025 [Brassica napus]